MTLSGAITAPLVTLAKILPHLLIFAFTSYKGDPVSVQVFEGNTSDNTTVVDQVQKISKQFGVTNVIFVGDRGMIKGPQINELGENFKYIVSLRMLCVT